MASDIVPIRLSLTEGDLVTLWAPRWREDGEEWEAFLGDEDALFAFPEVAQLAAYVRTAEEHDLTDHPAWSVVPDLSVAELTPEETQRYDIIGVPELAAQDADTWTIGELAEITEMIRSLAEVCGLEKVTEILDSTPGFALLNEGTLPFTGREGARLWARMVETIAERWDEVIDTLDELVTTPEVDATALAAAAAEAAALAEREAEQEVLARAEHPDADDAEIETEAEEAAVAEQVAEDEADDVPAGFWEEVGIDPIRITTRDGEFVTLRCYFAERPVFLGSDGKIDVFGSERALARHLAGDGKDGHDLVAASTWSQVVEKAEVGELEVTVDELNSYVLTGIDHDIVEGTLAVDPTQLELATELLLDVGAWADDDEPEQALAESERLGWLVSFVVRPDPTRLAPSPPFDAEAARWRELVEDLGARLREH
ncbi:primosomal protein [Pseudonocardia acidicola]|uniref:Primosomal protein n=1 Tax=Pseudonocardia acidicola TaxID=2724939 RepID=A0ABX1SE73_9PSEU|nr:primosomal protein [Pseudonocardia acidicola]